MFLLFLSAGVVTGDQGDDPDSNNEVDDEHKACKEAVRKAVVNCINTPNMQWNDFAAAKMIFFSPEKFR